MSTSTEVQVTSRRLSIIRGVVIAMAFSGALAAGSAAAQTNVAKSNKTDVKSNEHVIRAPLTAEEKKALIKKKLQELNAAVDNLHKKQLAATKAAPPAPGK